MALQRWEVLLWRVRHRRSGLRNGPRIAFPISRPSLREGTCLRGAKAEIILGRRLVGMMSEGRCGPWCLVLTEPARFQGERLLGGPTPKRLGGSLALPET